MVDETSATVGTYLLSWLHSWLTFPSISRFKGAARSGYLLNFDDDLTMPLEDGRSETFRLLDSSRTALFLSSNSECEANTCPHAPGVKQVLTTGDISTEGIELAIRLMACLTGQSRVLAEDWLKEARCYLEVKKITDALLAYAAAESFSSYQERL
ncbi:unnamed protein product [Protopolystoma xenopodis]|uniref:MICOS complex subunit MIC60 n=1 Tax=Protopolystoma xenopodis TaxID=117903 RepID=A0A3S5B2M8_9PLAT|nr:unnamed protein product [Protopolystoma xenopodis]